MKRLTRSFLTTSVDINKAWRRKVYDGRVDGSPDGCLSSSSILGRTIESGPLIGGAQPAITCITVDKSIENAFSFIAAYDSEGVMLMEPVAILDRRGIIDIGEELGADKSTKKGSNDTKEMVNVLSSMKAANILSSGGVAFSTASVSPDDVFLTASVPTVSAIFTIAGVATPYTRRSRGLDRNNEVIAKHLSEYEQAEVDLSVGEKIELISELVKYQDYLAEILKGLTLEQIKEKFIPVWKHMQDFVPMSSKEESEKLKRPGIKLDQGSSKRVKISHTSRSKPSQEQKFKGSKGVSEEELKDMMQLVPLEEVYIEALQGSKGVSEEELKEMMQLVPLEEVYIEALQLFDREDLHQLWILVKETFSIKQSTSDKEKELWVELKRLLNQILNISYGHIIKHSCMILLIGSSMIHVVFSMFQDEELFEASSP
nr:hypothetical protein [Tanacetum cinerariifolium]